MEIPERIRFCRMQNKETQAKIAEYLDIPQQQYCRYENGKNDIPVRYVNALCRHWDVTADFIIGLTDTPSPIHRESPVSN